MTYASGFQIDAAVFGSDGTVYVLDTSQHQILHFDDDGTFLSSFGASHLNNPHDMVFAPNGNLCVTTGNDDVQEFTPTGTYLGQFSDGLSAGMSGIRGIVFGPDGDAYETDYNTNRVYRFDGTTGAFLGIFAAGNGGFEDLHFGPDGDLYVASQNNNTIYRFDGANGAALGAFVSDPTVFGPHGFIFDQSGNLEVPNQLVGTFNTYDGSSGAYLSTLVSGLLLPYSLVQVPGNVIEGNLIGTNATASAALPNQAGIIVSASNTAIGGSAAAAGQHHRLQPRHRRRHSKRERQHRRG